MTSPRRPKFRLTRNLRKAILQGHPWVYREAIQPLDSGTRPTRACLAQVEDSKGEIAWAIYDPHSPLALRVLSLESAPPSEKNDFFERRFARAWSLRKTWLKTTTEDSTARKTTAFRLFNGEGDGLPGLVCDIYDQTAVLQFDGRGPGEFWNRELIANYLSRELGIATVVEKVRRPSQNEAPLISILGPVVSSPVPILENGAKFEVDIARGQKTGFFLDQRDNRLFVRDLAGGKTVLNLFSYTGGFSISAGLGGATHVTSVDLSKDAIQECNNGFARNGLNPETHTGIAADVFDFMKAGKETWDHVIVDPPSMSHSEDRKELAVQKYTELFSQAIRRVRREGEISLSSCSSHISFEDFHKITTESLSQARRKGTVLRISGQGADHPYPNACPELRYLKLFHLALD